MQEAKEFQLLQGDLFAERYRVERKLGEGGMGTVYLVTDTLLADEAIALKILHRQLTADAKQSQRFLREVQLTRRVTHPNIVRTFDVGTFAGRLFYTMEYTDGMSLQEALRDGPLSPDTAINILNGICEGLAAIHAAEITHRDLKPGNVILTPEGIVKIADFGVAKPESSELTGQDEVVGSTRYMAPEMWTGQNIGPWSDIYSLGVLSYLMVTGILPFEGETSAELMFKHMESRPVPPAELDSTVPGWLSTLIMNMLEKRADKRQTVTELLALLEQYVYPADFVDDDYDDDLSPRERVLLDSALMETTPFEGNELVVEGPPRDSDTLGGRSRDPQSLLDEAPLEFQQAAFSQSVRGETVGEPNSAKGVTVSRVVRVLFSFIAAGVLLYVASTVGAQLIETVWLKLTQGRETERVYLFVGLLPTILFFSVVASIPIFCLALLHRNAKESLDCWFKAAVAISFMFGMVFFFNSIRAGYKWYKVKDEFRLVSFFVGTEKAAQSTVQNMLEAAMLAPIGTFYDVKMMGGETGIPLMTATSIPTLSNMLPYYGLVFCFLLLTVWMLIRYVFRVQGSEFTLVAALLPIMLLLIAAEYLLRDIVSEQLAWNIHRVYLWSTGSDAFAFPIAYSFKEYSLFCGVLNWTILVFSIGVLIPLSLDHERSKNRRTKARKFRRSLHGDTLRSLHDTHHDTRS